MVHHGGAGTTTAAALSAAPQVIPQVYDQHCWAARADALEIGTAHAPGAPTMESLAAAVVRALDSKVALRAATVASMMRTDGARVAAQAANVDFCQAQSTS